MNDDVIRAWLFEIDTLDNVPSDLSRKRRAPVDDVTIPPRSPPDTIGRAADAPPRATSPSKRARVDGPGYEDEAAQTVAFDELREPLQNLQSPEPTAYFASLSSRRLSSHPKLTSASGNQSVQSRSSSPSKAININTLRELQKEVVFTQQPLRKNNLPDDGQRLWARIRTKAVDGYGTLPRLLQDTITELNDGDEIPEHRWANCAKDEAALLDELNTINIIVHESRECAYFARHESSWNTQVHYPAMSLAIPSSYRLPRGPVGVETITTATIATAFQPPFKAPPTPQAQPQQPTVTKSMTLQKLVDFALVLRTDRLSSPTLESRIDTLRCSQPPGQKTIGPSNAGSLSYFPVAVAVETKTTLRNTGEGFVQLGAWIAAWHHRMLQFPRIADPSVSEAAAPRLITMPLVFVLDHTWQLYLAVDAGSRIEIFGPADIGNTQDVDGMYRLLACLRELCHWVQDDFKKWFEGFLDQVC